MTHDGLRNMTVAERNQQYAYQFDALRNRAQSAAQEEQVRVLRLGPSPTLRAAPPERPREYFQLGRLYVEGAQEDGGEFRHASCFYAIEETGTRRVSTLRRILSALAGVEP